MKLKEYTFFVDVNDGEFYSTKAKTLREARVNFKNDHPRDYDKIVQITSYDGKTDTIEEHN